jgi:hypothetical protein
MRGKFWLANMKGRDRWEDLGADGKIISNYSFGRCGLD